MTPINLFLGLTALLICQGGQLNASLWNLDDSSRKCLSESLSTQVLDQTVVGKRDGFAVMDLYTGRILWLQNPKMLSQRAFQPGSLFKIITAYVALREKADPHQIYRCRGKNYTEGKIGSEVHCWLPTGHGPVNLAKALALSCNLYFAHLGIKLGSESLISGALEFGLGTSTHSDLPGEIAGSIPRFSEKDQAAQFAVGQGKDVLVTPLQMLSMIGAVVNGGLLLSPRRETPDQGLPVVRGNLSDAEALRFVRQALVEASSFGTGSKTRLEEFQIAGKTGTSTGEVSWKTHAWYIGFAPSRRPLVALVVFVYDGQGSKEAARLGKKVIETVYQAMQQCHIFQSKS